ncbi:MAG: hypothetical protein JSW39_29330 [Desulfobacterales bacterium]|nr:MAG: hypothetical protein JSW39_29330 [Desulfobacterales bacterium]
MQKIAKQSMFFFVIAMLVLVPLHSTAFAEEYFEAEDPSAGSMMFDFVFVRPVGMASVVVGSVFYVVALPFAALGGNADMAGEKLVKEPFNYTFSRPLGEF